MITYFYVRGKEKKMKSTKKKIVALSTAFVMAFALVAAMLPATVSEAAYSGTVEATITLPSAGDEVKVVTKGEESFTYKGQEPAPQVSSSTANVKGTGYFYLTSPEMKDDYSTLFSGKFEAGQTIYVAGDVQCEEGFSKNTTLNIKNAKNVIYEVAAGNPTSIDFFAEITIPGGGSTDAVPVKEGDNQTVASGSPVVISFDKDFSKFENGGAVFLDESTEPLSTDCYKATSGSTVITLLDSFTKTLKEGAHTLKVKFNDDSVGTATFTVSASANSDGSASGTSGTATSGTSSSAATTTKVAAPKTADVLPFAAIAVVFVGATAIGVIAIRRKNS
ncbi:MAG TPA: hypothetical protein DCR12_05270 [Lachnospiraceae bacterium]|nr:hypothetical protein [Lachnospiraceae bacterium]